MILREVPALLYALIEEYNAELWNDAPVTDERRLQIEEEIALLELTIEQKAESYANLIDHYTSEAETIKNEEKRLAAWRKRCENSAAWLDANLERTLLAVGVRKIEKDANAGRYHSFSFRRSESLAIRDEGALPERFIIPVPATTKPDNAEIKKAIAAACNQPKEWSGEFESPDIPGVALIVKQNLQIK